MAQRTGSVEDAAAPAAPGRAPAPRYRSHMFVKPLLIALLAACGVPSTPATTEPPDEQPVEPPDDGLEEGQHFCCEKFTTDGGNGCVTIGEAHVALCDKVLYCGGSYQYEKTGGTVKCLD
jgi:hypothetical protein